MLRFDKKLHFSELSLSVSFSVSVSLEKLFVQCVLNTFSSIEIVLLRNKNISSRGENLVVQMQTEIQYLG